MILIPEEPFDIEEVCALIRHRHEQGRYASIVVVAEGATPKEGTMAVVSGEVDQFGHVRLGGIGERDRSRDRGAHRLRDPSRRSSATSSEAARRPRSTGCCRRVSASPPSTRCTTARSVRWSRCGPARSCGCRWQRRWAAEDSRPGALPRRRRGLLRVGRRSAPPGARSTDCRAQRAGAGEAKRRTATRTRSSAARLRSSQAGAARSSWSSSWSATRHPVSAEAAGSDRATGTRTV